MWKPRGTGRRIFQEEIVSLINEIGTERNSNTIGELQKVLQFHIKVEKEEWEFMV